MQSPPPGNDVLGHAAGSDAFPRSAPRNTEEGRALLQARLAQFGRIDIGITALFLGMGLATSLVFELEGAVESLGAEALSLLVGVLVLLLTRGPARSERVLSAIDALAVWSMCGVFIAMGFALPRFARPELVQLVCVSNVLVLRAFLIPSSARRTAWVHSPPLLAIVASTFFLYRDHRPHPSAPSPGAYTVIAAILCLGVWIVTTLTSRTIFGLRERVREAFQLGQYTLLEKLGEGGMGVVYKARHATLRRPTAIKLLPPERAGEHNLARFEREVQLTSQLTHPNTIAIYDYGRSADGVLYYAMEYLDGLDLESLVAIDGPQPAARVVHILSQVAGALAEAHAVGLIHRDIKPGNVILCQRGGQPDVAKVVDFGLVKDLARAYDSSASMMDHIIGTPLYMSPEAIVAPDRVDARSDLYALGALGYFLLTGKPPFSGATVVEVCGHHLHTPATPPSERLGSALPGGVEALIMSCLEKDVARRPANAQQLLHALQTCAVPPWDLTHAADWWRTHAATITEQRRRRDPRGAMSTLPRETLAIDLRARGEAAIVPWHAEVR